MALGTFIAGRYTCTYDPPGATAAADIGIAEEGYNLSWSYSAEAIQASDAHGDAYIDGVFRGFRDVFCQATLLEWKTSSLIAATPFQALAATGATYLGPGVIGRLISDVAGIMIWTSVTATPSVSTPATLTATYAILAENHNVEMLLHSKLRKIPLRFRFLPYLDTVIKHFTAT